MYNDINRHKKEVTEYHLFLLKLSRYFCNIITFNYT